MSSQIIIDDRVAILCPECQTQMPVSIVVTVAGEPGDQTVIPEADLSDVWAHMWTHGETTK